MHLPRGVDATRAVYDATARAYVEAIGTRLDPEFEGPVERSLLVAFVELAGRSARPVADLGCGPGRVAAFLAEHGLGTLGLDLAPSMAHLAHIAHPRIGFGAADLGQLPLADASLGGAVCWYSVIHTPAPRLPALFGEVRRTLTAGAPLLVAFQSADDERVDRADAHGSGHVLSSFRHRPETVAAALADGGLDAFSTTVREPMLAHESTRQAFLLAIAG